MHKILRFVALSVALAFAVGCGGSKKEIIGFGTAPLGGTFYTVGGNLAEVLNTHPSSEIKWKVEAKETKGSQANIRDLANGKLKLAISNAASAYARLTRTNRVRRTSMV